MPWFSTLFLTAFVIALLTGAAYFRRVIHRHAEPTDYWLTVAGYLLLGLLEPVIRLFK